MTRRQNTATDLLEQARQARRNGDTAATESLARRAEAAATNARSDTDRALALAMQAQAARDAGDLPRSLALLQRAAQVCRPCKSDAPEQAAFVLRHLADVTRESGLPADAAAIYAETLSIVRASPATPPLTLANTLRGHALALKALHQNSDAAAAFMEAMHLYQQSGTAAGTQECQHHLAALSTPPSP